MAELPPRRSALSGALHAGDFGTVGASGPGVLVAERRSLALVQIAASSAAAFGEASLRIERALGVALPREPNRATAAGALAALWTAPGRALVTGDGDATLAERIAEALGGAEAAASDLSHARVSLRLEGSRLRELLAKGCGLDFHPSRFGAGAAVQSSYAHINVLLHARDAAPSVDLYVARSLARSLWEQLLANALEFGCRVAG